MTSQEHMSRQDFQALQAKPAKRQKYNARRVLVDGICFDSKAEANYHAHLKLRERAGEVTDVERQRPYSLTVNGVLVTTYIADFVFFDRHLCRRRIVDVKGVETRDFKIKRKLMKACFGLEIEVAR